MSSLPLSLNAKDRPRILLSSFSAIRGRSWGGGKILKVAYLSWNVDIKKKNIVSLQTDNSLEAISFAMWISEPNAMAM